MTRCIRCCTAITAILLTSALFSCTPPRISGEAESRIEASPCEAAYTQARASTRQMRSAPFAFMRYRAATEAAQEWTETASQCADRFAEGTMYAAQAQHQATVLGDDLGEPTADTPGFTSTLDDTTSLDFSATGLQAMALSEDRAGFIMEFLAARESPNASLSLSDSHKSTASRLISLAGNTSDPRQKVYDLSSIIAHTATVTDPATGLTAPTSAVTEMECAREDLESILGHASQTSAHATGITPSSSAGQPDASANSAQRNRSDTLKTLASLVSSRASYAFAFGYPSMDAALFES